jgi:hypothetical protein
VYTADNELLYYAPITTVDRLIKDGHVIPRGTPHRVRALIAVTGQVVWTLTDRFPTTCPRFSIKSETNDNPRGCWTFRRLSGTAALAHG